MKHNRLPLFNRLLILLNSLFIFALTDLYAENLTVHFTGMTPHVGKDLYLRVIDKGTLRETARTKVTIANADFDVVVNAVTAAHSYFVDFFADQNANGLYDKPPADHAWRLSLDNAAGNGTDELSFTHNTSFTDINWQYALTINFTGMTPHLNQLFELRVVNVATTKEIDRVKVDSIKSANFNISTPGIELNTEYNVDFYADFNGNKSYNAPPTDHTWRLNFKTFSGDTSLNFTHNTNFTDIQWPNVTAIENENLTSPKQFKLYQNYPNPFNPSTKIGYAIKERSKVILTIYNLLGSEVMKLINKEQNPGVYEVNFDASGLSNGVYFYRIMIHSDKLQAGDFSETKKMVLLR